MRYRNLLQILAVAVILFSCKKENGPGSSPAPGQKSLLKDVVIPNLPSPYYHFEYNSANQVSKASYLSGFNNYEVVYSGDKISEVRNNTAVNKDTLQYTYDEAGNVNFIKYVNKEGIVYKTCFLTYDAQQLRKIEWLRKADGGYIIERVMTFTYHPDGNLFEKTNHRKAINGQTEAINTDRFEQYDSKINTDGFSLAHEETGHLLVLPGIQFQKNNPGKSIRTGNEINYTIDYTYQYNNKNAPLVKTGDATFTSGTDAGQHFQVKTFFTYY